jgi:hypothetical protein
LAVKILAELIEVGGYINPGPLVAHMPAESRGLGLWNDRRDRRSQFPVIGNYAFNITTQVPFESAKTESIVILSNRIKKVAQRVRNDVEFRSHMLHRGTRGSDTDSFCGVSSVSVPKLAGKLGISPLHINSNIDFGPVPHVWFFVLSCGSQTSIVADIQLPIATLSPELVRSTIRNAAKGSALEPLFNKMGQKNEDCLADTTMSTSARTKMTGTSSSLSD